MNGVFFAGVRPALARVLTDTLGMVFLPEDFRLPAKNTDAATPKAIAVGADVSVWENRLREAAPLLRTEDGLPLIGRVASLDGWLCFDLHAQVFKEAVARLSENVPPPSPSDTDEILKLRMLIRYPSLGFADCPETRRALLLAYRYAEAPSAGRKRTATDAALRLFTCRPPEERTAFLSGCGDTARAVLALLNG